MTEEHPAREVLQRFMRGELPLDEHREIVRHLLRGCAHCVALTRSLWSLGETGERAALPPVVHRLTVPPAPAIKLSARQESRLAAIRLVELYDRPPAERLERVRADERFQLAALCRLLLKDAERRARTVDRLATAELAVALADRLDPERYGAVAIAALSLRAWTQLGLARRAASALAQAEVAAQSAQGHLLPELRGTGGEAHLLELQALLLLDREQPAEAERALASAVTIYRSSGRGGRSLGRALVRQGVVRAQRSDARANFAASLLLQEGLEVLDAEVDPRFSACALHWLGLLRAEVGAAVEALVHFARSRDLYGQAGDAENRARVWFAEGMMAADQGRADEADRALLAAEEEFLAIASGRSAAQALVQRTLLRLRQPAPMPLSGLGSGVLPILRCHDLSRGDAAALLLFRRLVESEQATIGLVSEVFRFLAGRQPVRRPRTECGL